jgi:hypothetical protein
MKRIIGLVLVAALAGALAVASQARTNASSSRTRPLHIEKNCTGTYNGNPGEYCTITSSNVGAIPAQSRIFYFEAATAGGLDSDVALYAGPGNVALGHVVLSFGSPPSGVITFRGGSGDFRGFRATADVTLDQNSGLWHWDGTYRFRGHGH